MSDSSKKSFNKRQFVTLAMAIAGLGLPISGLANHLLQMEPMGLPRHAWMSAHSVLGALFLVFAVWHISLNHRILFNYVQNACPCLPKMGREAFWAVIFIATALFIAVGHAFLAP
jgi:hypothetical protein